MIRDKKAENGPLAMISIVAIVGIVGIVGLLILLIGGGPGDVTGAATAEGGATKVNAGQCMKACLNVPGSAATEFDGRNSAVQACKLSCNEFEHYGECALHSDNCCVPGTDDPDCGPNNEPEEPEEPEEPVETGFTSSITGLTYASEQEGVMTQPAAVAYCDALVKFGVDDWRIPTFEELEPECADGMPPEGMVNGFMIWTTTVGPYGGWKIFADRPWGYCGGSEHNPPMDALATTCVRG